LAERLPDPLPKTGGGIGLVQEMGRKAEEKSFPWDETFVRDVNYANNVTLPTFREPDQRFGVFRLLIDTAGRPPKCMSSAKMRHMDRKIRRYFTPKLIRQV